MNNVLIEIQGGNIQAIYTNDINIKVHVIDYDNMGYGDELDLSPHPIEYTPNSFRDFFTDLNDPMTQEIYHELQRLHL
jgi:hypothetical protein